MISQPGARPVTLRRLARLCVLLCAAGTLPACTPDHPREGASASQQDAPAGFPPRYVAHGGGSAHGQVVTNSLQALNDSVARGHTFIEVDFSWTSDDRLVLLHDWHQSLERLFGAPPGEMTHADFMAAPNRLGLTQLDADGLFAWLARHPGIRIVTDIKGRSVEALERIARAHPELLPRIVPQLYSIGEHGPVVALGYPRVILTLYATPMEDSSVLAYAAEHAPLAVTMPLQRAAGPLPRALDALDVFSYAHTTSDYLAAAELFRNGIDGVYTDYLAPEDDALAYDETVAPPWSESSADPEPLRGGAVTFLPMAPGLRARLVAENPGRAAASVSAVALDAAGAEVGRAEWSVAAGAREVLPLEALAGAGARAALPPEALDATGTREVLPPGSLAAASPATLRLHAAGCPLVMTWELLHRPAVDVRVAQTASETHVFMGRADGLAAQAVLVFNPTDRAQVYRCEQIYRPPGARAERGKGGLVRSAWLRVPPDGMARKVFELPGPGAVTLRVSGGLAVVQPLRWSYTFSVLR